MFRVLREVYVKHLDCITRPGSLRLAQFEGIIRGNRVI